MRQPFEVLAFGLLGLASCASVPAPSPAARATLADASGRRVARAVVTEAGSALAVHIEAAGLAAGTYGVHLHSVGRCEAPAFASAGGHWNPTERQHGRDNPAGAHSGDLPNLVVAAGGHGAIDFVVPGGRLTGGTGALLGAGGAAIVIHAQADDYRTDPSGNSGARIACGVLGAG